jgi:hypothetical protein
LGEFPIIKGGLGGISPRETRGGVLVYRVRLRSLLNGRRDYFWDKRDGRIFGVGGVLVGFMERSKAGRFRFRLSRGGEKVESIGKVLK